MSEKNDGASRSKRAADAVRSQQREEQRRRNLMIGGVVVVLLAVVIAGYFVVSSMDSTDDVDAPDAGANVSGVQEYGVSMGDADAPRTVVIYEDFLCPYCGELERELRGDLVRLADDGKVRVEFRPFELLSSYGDYSFRATNAFAVVLNEVGAAEALALHDLLFENQPREGGDYPDNDQLVDWAVEAGASEDEVRGPIEDQEESDWVEAATGAAKTAGVQGTPTVLLDGKVFSDGNTVQQLAKNLVSKLE